MIASQREILFPLTTETTTMLIFVVAAVVIYLAGLSFALRMHVWLRRRPAE